MWSLEQAQGLVEFHSEGLMGFCGLILSLAQGLVGLCFLALVLALEQFFPLVLVSGSSQGHVVFPWPFYPTFSLFCILLITS